VLRASVFGLLGPTTPPVLFSHPGSRPPSSFQTRLTPLPLWLRHLNLLTVVHGRAAVVSWAHAEHRTRWKIATFWYVCYMRRQPTLVARWECNNERSNKSGAKSCLSHEQWLTYQLYYEAVSPFSFIKCVCTRHLMIMRLTWARRSSQTFLYIYSSDFSTLGPHSCISNMHNLSFTYDLWTYMIITYRLYIHAHRLWVRTSTRIHVHLS